MQAKHSSRWRRRGISWAPVLFLLGFLALLGIIVLFFVEPMAKMAESTSPETRRKVSAYATLLLTLLLSLLLLGLVFTLRIARRKPLARRRPTRYIDAWGESARRMKTPSPDELEDDQ